MADIGAVLGGRYRLVELLGQGGMATIYRARDNQLERDVAVKILRPEYGADPDFNERFRHEAQSAASLNHPSVVAVYDYGTDPVGPFIVMELVEGEDLATIIRRSGALPPRAAARLVDQAARAVAAAHARGFVHRDIKPGNILVTHEGRVKVADFGIARALSESALTLPGTTLGSVHYFSPEQARGELATPASDIYSLGIVLFELLTGKRPWTGDTAAAIATARLTGAVPSPAAVHGGIPPTLDAIARKALATNPDDRYASANDMADALERYLGEERGAEGQRSPRAAAGAGAAAGASGAAAGAAAGASGAAAGAAGAAPTMAAGVAKPNPEARIAYPAEAYAGRAATPTPPRNGGLTDDPDDIEPGSRAGGPWLWISAVLAIAILALAAFVVVKLTSGPGPSTPPQVQVPNLVGLTFEAAKAAAATNDLQVLQVAFESSTATVGTVTKQDPAEGASVAAGSVINLTMAISPQGVAVPDLRGRIEQDAVNLIAAAGLTVGARTEDFDPFIPAGSVVSNDPGPNDVVLPGTAINYIVSKGPQPTPTPAPTPVPTAVPTPTPAPVITPKPTPSTLTVKDYRCTLLAIAQAQIQNDGFALGSVSGPNDPASIVVAQDPAPNTQQPPGTPINLTVVAAPAETCPA
ncbi:MAG TPA: Stk1 family PASTA domain-containing Ser/Thr kinase [Candidatus Limnocylindrales bacterium]